LLAWCVQVPGFNPQDNKNKQIHCFFFFLIHLFICAISLFIHLFICVIVWDISPPCPPAPFLSSHPPGFQAEPALPSSPILLREDISNNKKDKAFLLVEIRIAIERDS
jgi:hypothetical protein